MNKKTGIIIGVLALLLVVTGVVVYKAVFSGSPVSAPATADITPAVVAPVDSSISVDLTKSTTAANTVIISVKGMGGKMVSVAYELMYESKGVTQGVTGKSVDVAGKDTFERDLYLGTCSRNVCTPHLGVSSVNLVLVFTDTAGKQTQFSKDYTL
jgi:hypothetical protein